MYLGCAALAHMISLTLRLASSGAEDVPSLLMSKINLMLVYHELLYVLVVVHSS